ncbi:MAG: FRG domain-containing protein [Phycisphaerales bacterium]|nr:MAG: FRG domain-containing protein [Phycisphaerales bacterium]
MTVKTIPCASASEVIAKLWEACPMETGPDGLQRRPWIFRGHACASWSLLASSHRELLKTRDQLVIDRRNANGIALNFNGTTDKIEPVRLRRIALIRATRSACLDRVLNFGRIASELGLLSGTSAKDYHQYANGMQSEPPTWRTDFNFHMYTSLIGLAQHNGVPTPFLDWTASPLVAIWFACDKVLNPENGADKVNEKDACVWAFPLTRLERGSHTENIGINVIRITDQTFPVAQGGIFTHDTLLYADYERDGTTKTLDERVAVQELKKFPLPTRVCFQREWASELMTMLSDYGVTGPRLMPTLPRVGQECLRILPNT